MVLTARQQEVLTFLRTSLRRSGLMPSTREVQQHFGFASQTAAVNHLRALERKGAIKRWAGKARAVRLAVRSNHARLHEDQADSRDGRKLLDIPVFGSVPAGMSSPIDAEPAADIGCVSLDLGSIGVLNRGRTFAVRVRGDSMIGAHIQDGDLVILEAREARRRDIVAALIDGETTLKRYDVEHGRPVLRAENPAYPDLHPERDLSIQGVMIALVRPV